MRGKHITIVVDEELYTELASLAVKKFKGSKGSIKKAVIEAIQLWIEKNKHV